MHTFEKLPFLALSAACSVVTLLVQREGGSVSTDVAVGERLGSAFVAYLAYLGKLFWPAKLVVFYPHPGSWPFWIVLACAGVVVGSSAIALLLARRWPYFPTGWFWFLVALVPVIGLVQAGSQFIADRYTYVPLIGLFIIGVWSGGDLIAWRPVLEKPILAAAGLLLLGCAGLTWKQLGFWQDSGTLFRHAVAKSKESYVAYNSLGSYYAAQGETDKGLECFNTALALNPHYSDALNNVGFSYVRQGRFQNAVPYLEAALKLDFKSPEVHHNLGRVREEQGELAGALAEYRQALRLNPEKPGAYLQVGRILNLLGRHEEARAILKEALRLQPEDALVVQEMKLAKP